MLAILKRSYLETLILLFLAFAVLWKGGKALDATWILAFTASVVVLVDIFFIAEKQKVSAASLPWLLSLTFLALTLLSFLSSSTKNYGFDEVSQTASLFLLFLFVLKIPAPHLPVFQSRLARVIAISTLLACAVGIAVYALQPVSRFVGTFFDYRFHTDYWPNAWAEYLLLAWPLMAWVFFGRKKHVTGCIADVVGAACVGLTIGCLLLSYSRGSLIAFFLQHGLLGMFIFSQQKKMQPSWRNIRIVVITIVLAFAVFAGVNHLRSQLHTVQSAIDKVTFTSEEGTSSVSEREQFWHQALQFAKQRPLLGWGPYSFRFLQPQLQEAVLATSDHPHNVFLKIAMERGLPATLIFLVLLLVCIGPALRDVFSRKTSHDSFLTAFLLTSVLGVLAHNMIDYNLQFIGVALPFWLILGSLARRGDIRRGSTVQTIFAFLVTTALCIVMLSEGKYLLLSSKARAAEVRGDVAEALRWYGQTEQAMFPRDEWLSRASLFIKSNNLEKAQSAIDESLSLNDQDYRIWKLQGDLYLKQNKKAEALVAFEKAYTRGRWNDLGITRVLIELLMSKRPSLDARRHEFELLLNEYGFAIEHNMHFIDLSTNVEELEKVTALLARAYPAEAAAYRSLAERSREHADMERARLTSRPRGLLW